MWEFQEILLCIEIDNLSLEDQLVFFIHWMVEVSRQLSSFPTVLINAIGVTEWQGVGLMAIPKHQSYLEFNPQSESIVYHKHKAHYNMLGKWGYY